jgi:hypothetical protein
MWAKCFGMTPERGVEGPPVSDLTRPGNDVALNLLELRLRLFHSELLVPTRLLKHLPARCDTTNRATGRHGFDTRIE